MTTARNHALLVAGIGLFLVSNGRLISPAATLLCAPLLLVFVERQAPISGSVRLAALFIVASWSIWWGIIPLRGVLFGLAASAYGVAHVLPYVVHRVLTRADDKVLSTLCFPSAYVLMEAVLGAVMPYGSWGSVAYAFPASSGVAQLSAAGGLALVTFAIAWTGSLLAWLWRMRSTPASIFPALLLIAGATFVGILPAVRLHLMHQPRAVVQVATIAPVPQLRSALTDALRDNGLESPEVSAAAATLRDDLLARTREAGQLGARLVVWSETAAQMQAADETDFHQRVAAVAKQEQLYVVAAYGLADPTNPRVLANRLVAVTPDGVVAWVYDKAFPIVGSESASVRRGTRKMSILDTPFGRIGAAICHDADFPDYVHQARSQRVDILVNPADDWAAIQHMHANMAVFRAVENGLTLIRAAKGVSVIAGPYGNVVATWNSFAGEGLDMIAHVPVRTAAVLPNGRTVIMALAAVLMALLCARRCRTASVLGTPGMAS
jgi:apolipoprotein N-acyltransferase